VIFSLGVDRRRNDATRDRRLVFLVCLVLLNVFAGAAFYFATVVWRSSLVYDEYLRWNGKAYHADPDYGYYPTANALAYQSLVDGKWIPIRFDEHGFRIPASGQEPADRTGSRLLFLGDSFTHGYGVTAEETFAYRTAKQLGASVMNAGVSGWGLAQMVMRARQTIPSTKPDKVIVQYSTWLPQRSMKLYVPRSFGNTANPYFYESDAAINIHPPVFQNINLQISPFVGQDKTLLSFAWNIGMALFSHDDYVATRAFIVSLLGFIPQPIASRQVVVEHAYREIRRLCVENDAEMIILILPNDIDNVPTDQLDTPSAHVVDVREPLAKQLPEPSAQAWDTRYKFWNNGKLVDNHPNAEMHAEIAKILYEAIR
jgi:hypothetical protein